jgi:hypothetical protein
MSAEGNPVPPRVDATTEKTKGSALKKKMKHLFKTKKGRKKVIEETGTEEFYDKKTK